MSEKDLENLMEIAVSDYEIACKNGYNDIMSYNRGKIVAYNKIAIILGFKMQVDYSSKLDKFRIIYD